jgi:hypothetical protein
MSEGTPALSVVVPTFNNETVLRRCLESWRVAADVHAVEIIVVVDGCRDGTAAYLHAQLLTAWGRRHLRAMHMDDAHELRCTNAGMAAARAPLVMAWQDDMLLRGRWLVPEVLRTFETHGEIGLFSLSRGLEHHPVPGPIASWDDLVSWQRLRSTIGPAPWNWLRVQEVDSVIRPWVVRRACIERVGPLDEAFVPTEWDEADLAYRIRAAGWKVATCGYERLGGYEHLGSSTLGALGDAYKQRVLKNGLLFHQRWACIISSEHDRGRRTWPRTPTVGGWLNTAVRMGERAWRTLARSPGRQAVRS